APSLYIMKATPEPMKKVRPKTMSMIPTRRSRCAIVVLPPPGFVPGFFLWSPRWSVGDQDRVLIYYGNVVLRVVVVQVEAGWCDCDLRHWPKTATAGRLGP